MRKIHFKKIPKNAKLLALGNFFKSDSSSDFWKVATYFDLKDGVSHTPFFDVEVLPIMGIGREFEQSEARLYKSMEFSRGLTLPPVSNWDERPLGDFPRLPKALAQKAEIRNQNCSVFESDNLKIWLPKFELARKLFFHAGFLSRAAFLPNSLDMLFNIERDPEEQAVRISTPVKTGVPTAYFRRKEYREFFAWLLLNENIRLSFQSIWSNLNSQQTRSNGYSRWQFDFVPPKELSGLKITALGPCHFDIREMLVWEIGAIHGLPNNEEAMIKFFHPNIKQSVKGAGEEACGGNSQPEVDGVDVDTEKEPDSDKERELIELPSESLTFSNCVMTKIEYNGKRKADYGTKDEQTPGEQKESKILGTKDDVEDGTETPGDINQLDEEENVQQYVNRFNLLTGIIKNLAVQDGVTFDGWGLKPLPAVIGCRFHMLDNGMPRYYLLARFELSGGSSRYILEIDTSDRKKSLSTKVFSLKSKRSISHSVEEILLHTVKRSLRWSNVQLEKYCEDIKEIVHPKNKQGEIGDDAISNWQLRLFSALILSLPK